MPSCWHLKQEKACETEHVVCRACRDFSGGDGVLPEEKNLLFLLLSDTESGLEEHSFFLYEHKQEKRKHSKVLCDSSLS